MSFTRAVIRTAISLPVCTALFALMASAQTTAAPSPTLSGTPPAADVKHDPEVEYLKKEIRELQRGQEELRKEFAELKQLLLARQPERPAPPERISVASRPSRGSDIARVVVVEFSDYQCPFCALFFRQTLPQLDQDYIRTGKIKYVFNNVPLDQIHPAALKAAEAAECAGEQSKFWEMHDQIFINQKSLSTVELDTRAKAIGLDMPRFTECLESGKNLPTVREGLALAEKMGVEGTPTFIIALADAGNPNGTNLKILSIISGAQPYPVFKATLDKALAMK